MAVIVDMLTYECTKHLAAVQARTRFIEPYPFTLAVSTAVVDSMHVFDEVFRIGTKCAWEALLHGW